MRLSDTVEKRDVDEAVRLIKTAMQQSATDPKTGEINMDIITTGMSSTSQDKIEKLCEFIKNLQREHRNKVNAQGLKYYNLFEFLNSKASQNAIEGIDKQVSEIEFRDALRQLEEANIISLFGNKRQPIIRFIQEV